MRRLWKLLVPVLAVLLTLVACGGGNPPPVTEDAVIIPDTTKVIDPATRDLLTSFTEAGALHFAETTPQLQALAVGDVVVSEPTGAAAFGFLRKVTALRADGQGLIVETEAATLDDAVDQGELIIAAQLTFDQLVSTQVFLEGVSIQSGSELDALQDSADKYDFTIDLDHVLFDLDGNDATKGDQVVISGKFQFDVLVNLRAKLRLTKPRLDFEAMLGFRQKAELNFDAIAALKLKKELKVADLTFPTQTFFIGGVPVVFTPKIEVVIGVDGDLRAQTKISVIQTASVQIGAKYTSDDGWRNLSSVDLGFDFKEPSIDGVGTKAKGFVGPKAILLFYGAAGIGAFGKASGELDVKLGRDPHWLLTAGLTAELGIEVKLPIIGNLADFKFVVVDERIELARSQNAAPTVTILEPTRGAELTLNRRVNLIANALDLEDGTPSISWSSDVDGALGSSVVSSPTFTTAGPRILTVVATDSHGQSASDTGTVNVVNTPPMPFGAGPGGMIPATAQALFLGGARDVNDLNEFGNATGMGVVTCDRIGWSVSAPDVLGATSGCQVLVTFNEVGLRTVMLTATDSHGASTSLDMLVSVGPPPPDPAPIITSMSIRDIDGTLLQPGAFIAANNHVPLTLEVSASDAEGDSLTFSWQASSAGGPFAEVGTSATTILDPNDVFATPPATQSGGAPLVIRVIVSDGSTEIYSPQLEFTWGEVIN